MSFADKAAELMANGCNCAQSVFCAFAPEFGIDLETAKKISCGLGGGVGQCREVCGTVTAASLVMGLKYGSNKMDIYPKVKEIVDAFKAECGSCVCRELLAGVKVQTPTGEEILKKRPCPQLVRLVAGLLEERLFPKA